MGKKELGKGDQRYGNKNWILGGEHTVEHRY